MSAANKAKGSRWEIELETFFNDSGLKSRRLPRAGVNDIGDVSIELKSGKVLVIEAKNVKQVNLADFLRQAMVEAVNYEAKYKTVAYPVVMVKTRQKGTSEGRVTLTIETLIELLREEGLV
jgi:Holliday junction resolvase